MICYELLCFSGIGYLNIHYENKPIQIYRKLHLQNWKISDKKTLIFFIFLLKT